MLEIIIKYFFIIICALYSYKKLLHLKEDCVKNKVLSFLFTLGLSIIVYFIKDRFSYIIIPIIVIACIVFLKYLWDTPLELSICATTISFAVSYITFTLSTIVNSVFDYLFAKQLNWYYPISIISICLIQGCMIYLLFKVKRLKKGMPYLINNGDGNTGVLISVFIINSAIIFSSNKGTNLIYIVSLILILFCAVFILFWWRSRITKMYMERLKDAEIQSLYERIEYQKEKIQNLEYHNEKLASIIHTDNKIVPALEFAVRDYLEASQQLENADLSLKKQELLKHLESLTRERSGFITKYEFNNKKLPPTNIFSVDGTLNYMASQAKEENINFNLTLSGSIKYMVKKIISEINLNIILSDLIENAMIAVKNCKTKNILINMGVIKDYYIIEIIDSGEPFNLDVLADFGLNKITTHKDEGGSGIGLTTIFDILKIYNASFFVEEFENTNPAYTKKITIQFDLQNKYIIKSHRWSQIRSFIKRDDLIIIPNS